MKKCDWLSNKSLKRNSAIPSSNRRPLQIMLFFAALCNDRVYALDSKSTATAVEILVMKVLLIGCSCLDCN